MPKLSIVIPAFNCESYIGDCIRSVAEQSESDLEILAVDDGSTDHTLLILERLAAEDRRISVQSYRPNSGYPGFARNRGIARATGEYIAFLDGDDLYHPRKLSRALSVFEAFPEADVVFHDVLRFDGKQPDHQGTSFLSTYRFTDAAAGYLQKATDRIYRCDKDLYRFASLNVFPVHTSAITIRRAVLLSEPVWFPEGRHGEDGDLYLRLLKNRRVVFVDEVLSYYRQSSGSITSDNVKYLGGAVQTHRDNLERGKDVFTDREQQLYRSKIAKLLSALGYAYFRRSGAKDARLAYRESLASDFRIDTLLAYLKTFMPRPVVIRYRKTAEQTRR